jgi:hypothetical protein
LGQGPDSLARGWLGSDERELFERVHHTLAGGGYFVNADQISGETPEEEVLYREWWLRPVREAGVSEEVWPPRSHA